MTLQEWLEGDQEKHKHREPLSEKARQDLEELTTGVSAVFIRNKPIAFCPKEVKEHETDRQQTDAGATV